MQAPRGIRLTRLGVGEWILGFGSVLLLADLFGLSWFRARAGLHATALITGGYVRADGWQSLGATGPLALIVCLAGIAVWWLAATRRSPAMPVAITILLTPVALILAALTAIRVFLAQPTVRLLRAAGASGAVQLRPGAYLGVALSLAVFAGAYLALRRDNVAPEDAPAEVELVPLTARS